MGGLTLGACVSGLVANAGIGLALLVKQNENKKHTLYILKRNIKKSNKAKKVLTRQMKYVIIPLS